MRPRMTNAEDRIGYQIGDVWVFIEDGSLDTPCHVWQGAVTPDGYAHRTIAGREATLHRRIYAALYGPIPDGYQVHHRCETEGCINPGHLDAHSLANHRALHRRLDWEEIADLRQRGWLIKDIAAKVGATKSGVKYALMMHRARTLSVARPEEDT